MIFVLVLLFVVMLVLDWMTIRKTNQRKKTIVLYLFIFMLSFVVAYLQVVDIELDSPSEVIEFVVNRIIGK